MTARETYRAAVEAAEKALKDLGDLRLRHILLDVGDGPEGIRIYASEEEGISDWSSALPAVYVEISIQGSNAKFGPFQMPAILEQLTRQIRPLPQHPIHQRALDPFEEGS